MLPTCGFLSCTNFLKCVFVQGTEARQPPVSYIRLGQELFSSIFQFQMNFVDSVVGIRALGVSVY